MPLAIAVIGASGVSVRVLTVTMDIAAPLGYMAFVVRFFRPAVRCRRCDSDPSKQRKAGRIALNLLKRNMRSQIESARIFSPSRFLFKLLIPHCLIVRIVQQLFREPLIVAPLL